MLPFFLSFSSSISSSVTGGFEDENKYPCPGCQDGYFITDMVQKHGWSMQRAPIVQFNSLIFHGPSPLYCIASGECEKIIGFFIAHYFI